MIEKAIVVFNGLSAVIFSVSLCLVVYGTFTRKIHRDTGAFLGVITIIFIFVGAGNVIDHMRSVEIADFYEDFAEMFIPLFFLVFLNSIRLHADIDERVKKQKELNERLCERDELLKEIHHRVKNNLQIVNSILNLQRGFHSEDKKLEEILMSLENRIFSMSAVYEAISLADNFASIPAEEFIKKIAFQVSYNSPAEIRKKKISITYDIDGSIKFTIERAVPLGMLVNEIVTNSFLHAFQGRAEGKIRIAMKKTNGTIALRISDDGRGIYDGFPDRDKTAMGTVLINNLSAQLNGTLTISSFGGTAITVEFDQ